MGFLSFCANAIVIASDVESFLLLSLVSSELLNALSPSIFISAAATAILGVRFAMLKYVLTKSSSSSSFLKGKRPFLQW